MVTLSTHDPTLFKGTASYYARYRPPYPNTLFEVLSERFNLNGQGRLLDLGCGTGHIAIPLSDRFQEVVGVDPQPEMLREARKEAEAFGASNITWVEQSAELFSSSQGFFKLVTIGDAFCWMKKELVLERCYDLLSDDGGLAIVYTNRSFWKSTEIWKQKTVEVIKKWLGEERRAGTSNRSAYSTTETSAKDLLAQSSFARVAKQKLEFKHYWNIDKIIGYLYSTSFCSREFLGDRVTQFEEDLNATLIEVVPSGEFIETIPLTIHLAWKR
ncbi:methyltransferase domain-containing protein [Scytonema sp. UIC 10036]|uniref:class I SAM-dependent methyltransferase n=1 Tax=Scytonema sp. UIC 10036 TaxID=2304196 RepID=UPI0012DA4A44|nr:class I SAM-dependent methyltransferase [Scytonema sp. UIC 10036]MUG92073.1 methyltransferase domain-containing protein [Scytonema sp. UIC 10036]